MAHRKTVRHLHEVGHLHELTFSCYRRMPLLTNDSWREKLARCVEAAGKECFRFWQEGPGFDRNLFSPGAITASLEYLHNNPLSRGRCRRAVGWKWSSARYYLDVSPKKAAFRPANDPRFAGRGSSLT